jgi:DNA-directed RNA polymerase alpha subunit
MTKEELLDCFATEAMKAFVAKTNGLINAYHVSGEAYILAEKMVERRQEILRRWKLAEDVEQHGIEKLNLTVRTERCLKADGIFTIQQLQGCTEHKLMKIPNLGRKSINEINGQMSAIGFKLKERFTA